MKILNSKRLSECVKFGTGIPQTQREYIEKNIHYLEVLFTLKRAKKVVIEVFFNLFLVFDANDQIFYFVKDPQFPSVKRHWNCRIIDKPKYTVDKNDTVYMYWYYKDEIRTFDYCNDKLVETGTVLEHFVPIKRAKD